VLNARTQQLAGLGAFAVSLGILGAYALLAYIATPKGTAGIDRANAAIVYISAGMVVLALVAVHVVLGRQLLNASRRGATRA
jgi:hypothetical protein